MKKTLSLCFSIVALVPTFALAAPKILHGIQRPRLNAGERLEGEIIVKFRPAATPTSHQRVFAKIRGFKETVLNARGFSRLKLPKGSDTDAALRTALADPDVEFAHPNYIYRQKAVPNDALFGQMWGLRNTGQTVTAQSGPDTPDSTSNPGTAGNDMGLVAAWDRITDCSSVVVAVVDSGVNYNHEDLAANMWNGGASYPNHGYDFINNTNNPMDLDGHGTHVAGTIAAVGNNGVGSVGICWKAQIMAVRVVDAAGASTTATLIQGLDFAINHGAKVVNISLGTSSFDTSLSNEVTAAQNAGVVLVVAAGNDGVNNDDTSQSPTYPCAFTQPNIICVAALDQKYNLASFSNYGAKSVALGAPGVNIVSTWPGTVSVAPDSLASGWTFSSTTSGTGWGYRAISFDTGPINLLANPYNYDGYSKTYKVGTDDRAYKNFTVGTGDAATLNFSLINDLQTSQDYLNVNMRAASSTDPFAVGGTALDQFTGTSNGYLNAQSYDASGCLGSNCTFGFQLTSATGSASNLGVGIGMFSINTLHLTTNVYNVIEGTSMATPHVTGLVAMILAFNPSYTWQDAVSSVKNGGIATAALNGYTSSGKAANAMGSLAYINAPTGVSAVPAQ